MEGCNGKVSKETNANKGKRQCVCWFGFVHNGIGQQMQVRREKKTCYA